MSEQDGHDLFVKGISDLNDVIKRILGEESPTPPDRQLEAVSDRTASLSTNYRTTGPTLSEEDERRKPYPWCHGNPTIQDCIEAGYCRRDPSCGD